MAKKIKELQYVETEGGPFVVLPLDNKKGWKGTGDEDDEDDDEESDYDRAEEFLSTVGVLTAGKGQVLILGNTDVTTFLPTADGGVFVQRYADAPDAAVRAAVDAAVAKGKWKSAKATFDAGKGKLAVFDSAFAFDEADDDEILTVELGAGAYAVATATVKTADLELNLVRLTRG